jgi:anti-sigma B factor antagonist
MERPYQHIEVERTGDVFCIRLRKPTLDETGLHELSDELNQLLAQEGCRKLVFSLGPEEPQCLYSIFLAKLVSLQRRLKAAGGGLLLCQVGPDTLRIFDACGLASLFTFVPDKATAVAGFAEV